tara:strand:- start:1156 stop:1461 length:306 start_codon:yes stop_codon:yes gene_type:complete
MWVGKCPSTLTPDDHVRLINEAVPGNNGDRDLEFPKKIYAVENGAIYEGQTTDRGYSYHGYPYRGKLSQGIIDLLRNIATQKSCELEFNAWIKQHIEAHGK